MEKSIYSAEYRELCRILRELRKEAGLTQVQVAEHLGVPQSFVSKYESGERRLDLIEVRQVAKVLQATVVDIIERLDEVQT
ncbi:helix-turn-helix domain-containing protein [Amycolatopsis methanolica]|uniref:helix-turn-helix domain-containing protein n=1 Tax=Amycolatopsis methanolica TaxID=1814 RepID=UPI00036A5D9D|nr:helix-turn-helix transcriptional regulator [Amycolatopsis methanolica]